jgi:hypothetical protein
LHATPTAAPITPAERIVSSLRIVPPFYVLAMFCILLVAATAETLRYLHSIIATERSLSKGIFFLNDLAILRDSPSRSDAPPDNDTPAQYSLNCSRRPSSGPFHRM